MTEFSQRRHSEPTPRQISRRKFARISLTAIAAAGVATFLEKVIAPAGAWGIDKILRADKLVNSSFRITDHNSLLNLEYYFINCQYHKGKLWAKYGPYENYMVVRLPQQHIAENDFPEFEDSRPTILSKKFKAATYISNYSYLVFRILFPDDGFVKSIFTGDDGRYTHINLTKRDLLDWNCEEKFRLVVRQDFSESLFELAKGENHYPFQQPDPKDSLRINADSALQQLPRAYGGPITAIEMPWRLIISPKLPDSSKYKFHWHIPETSIAQRPDEKQHHRQRHKLWTATLSVTERTDKEYTDRVHKEKAREKDHRQASTQKLDRLIAELELMILGSPDSPHPDDAYKTSLLPSGANRKDLVALYIQLKVLARTDGMTFSPLGATTKIHLKNEQIEEAFKRNISVIEWNQIISLGRDEKVEISTLFLEAEFGHKMAYIQITERKLQDGSYPLIRKEFIMPLDITKDYTNHITQSTTQKDRDENPVIVSRFNAPFKKITFLETKPKELVNKPFDVDGLNHTGTSFQFEAVDWHDNTIRFSKEINALTFNYAISGINGMNPTDTAALKRTVTGSTAINPSDTVSIIPDSARFIFKNAATILSDPAKGAAIHIIDANLGVIRDSTKGFSQSLTLAYSGGDPLPPAIRIDEFLDEVQDYYDNFFRYIKDFVSRLYADANATIENVTNALNGIKFETVQAFLIDRYFFRDDDTVKRLENAWTAILIDGKTISKPDDYLDLFLKDQLARNKTEFGTHLANILHAEPVSDHWDELSAFAKGEFKKWVIVQQLKNFSKNGLDDLVAKFQTAVAIATDPDSRSYLLLRRIQTDFPEISRVVTNLVLVFKQEQAKADGLIENIRKRVQLFYDIEQQAKKVPGLILLQKQKIGYALKVKLDAEQQRLEEDLETATGEVKKSLSELESEYIIFTGGLRQAADSTFDFFNVYAIIPQLEQAKVYVSALNKLVYEDLPISINYARDYIQNQVEDLEFEVKANAAMVFAEVQQASREQVKSLIQNIGDKMPGFNIEIPAHYLTYATNPAKVAEDGINKIKAEFGDQFSKIGDQLQNYSRDLIFISEEVKSAVKVVEDLQNVDPKKYFRGLGAKLFGSIGLEDILDIGFDLPRITHLPDKLIYQVSTDKFADFQSSFVKFKPDVGGQSRLELFISKSLKNVHDYYAYTQLNNFSIGIIIGGTEVLNVTFDQFKITSSPGQPKKTDVEIKDVKLGGPLEFLAELAKKFMAPGNGMRIKPGPKNLLIDYTIALPDIIAPAFNFKNLQFIIGLNIPYDPSTLRPISVILGVNKPEDKFLVSAGIYGGRGHFQMRATPKGIDMLDISMELGAYASIDLGIGKGEVFLFFGFWFMSGKDDDGQDMVKAVAYVICAGSATVLGFITIGVSVLIALTYIKRGSESLFYGEAVVTYSVKIAFFKKEFSIRYYKEIAGSSKGNGTHNVPTDMVMLDIGGGSDATANSYDENKQFADVFEDTHKLKEYLACFA